MELARALVVIAACAGLLAGCAADEYADDPSTLSGHPTLGCSITEFRNATDRTASVLVLDPGPRELQLPPGSAVRVVSVAVPPRAAHSARIVLHRAPDRSAPVEVALRAPRASYQDAMDHPLTYIISTNPDGVARVCEAPKGGDAGGAD